jgi:HAD superfamily hydrolase (TIGR01509 family)
VTLLGGCILDVDGVLVDSPHERAWRETLDDLMDGPWRDTRERTGYARGALTPEVYQRHVAGKPRLAGARAALAHLGVPDAGRRAREYAALKQRRVEELIGAGEFAAFPDAIRFVLAFREAGIPIAAASSSKNADQLLQRVPVESGVTLADCFDADTSGAEVAHGKPAPDLFLAAAAALGVAPGDCMVVEDAPAGIQAARAAGMFALGVAHGSGTELLERAEADLVVDSLDEVDLSALLGRATPAAGS